MAEMGKSEGKIWIKEWKNFPIMPSVKIQTAQRYTAVTSDSEGNIRTTERGKKTSRSYCCFG